MRRTSFVFMLFLASSFLCMGQASYPAQTRFSTVKDLVEKQGGGKYSIKAIYVETLSLSELLFSVEEEDYIIPVQLVKKDLGAEKRFRALNLKKGDTLTVEGILGRIYVGLDEYTGLKEAIIIDKKNANGSDVSHDSLADTSEAIPFQLVEEKPSFMGGDANVFSQWVNSHLEYPAIAQENGVQGRVTVRFTINADGHLTNIHVIRGVDEALDKEAVRVISHSPKWTPGRSCGKAVDVIYTFPVIFQLR